MNTWFSSDHHLGHRNILKYTNRPFSSVEEMDDILILRWNEVVKKDDTVYHLGDFCMGDEWNYLSRLNGNILFIKGSHDSWMNKKDYPYLREITVDNYMDEVNSEYKKLIVLCHYSLRSWNKSHYASWHLFGHHHGNLEPYGLSFDVGVDCWDFYPVSFEQVREKMSKLSPIVDYRKK